MQKHSLMLSNQIYNCFSAKPKYIKFESVVYGRKGSNIVLTCETAARPLPNYTWVNERIDLSSGRYLITTAFLPDSNRFYTNLTIHNVSVYDIGVYKCRFWNYKGSIEGSLELEIGEGKKCNKNYL